MTCISVAELILIAFFRAIDFSQFEACRWQEARERSYTMECFEAIDPVVLQKADHMLSLVPHPIHINTLNALYVAEKYLARNTQIAHAKQIVNDTL